MVSSESVESYGRTRERKRTGVAAKVSPNSLVDDEISVLLVLVESDDGRRDVSSSLGVVKREFVAAERLAIDPSREKRLGEDNGVGRVDSRVTLIDGRSEFCASKGQFELESPWRDELLVKGEMSLVYGYGSLTGVARASAKRGAIQARRCMSNREMG